MGRLGLCVLAAFALVSAVQAAEAPVVATQFRGGPAHLGVFAGPPAGNLDKVLWRFQTGHMVSASPTVADGVVYVGSRDGYFYALDEATGRPRWKVRADAGVTSSAAISDGLVWFQSDANTLYALHVKDGSVAWKRGLGSSIAFVSAYPESGLADYWTSSPMLYGGRLYIGGGDGAVHALDARTGKPLWTYQTKGRVRATPATDGERVYAGSFDGVMYALDINTGALAWSFKTQGNDVFPVGHIQSSPAVADGKVIFGSRDFRLYALDARTGKEAWKLQHEGSWIISSPAVSGEAVCIGGSDTQMEQCLDIRTGKELWRTGIRNNIFSSAAIAGERLYTGSFMGGAVAFRMSDGQIVGFNIADGRSNSSPWIDNGVLFIGSDNGSVYAFADKPHDKPKG